MSFATDMQKVATDLLSKFDERTTKIQLISPGERVWDAGLGEYVFGADTTIDLTGVATTYNQSLVNETTIRTGDIQLTLTNAVEVNQDDKILLDGVQHSVVSVEPSAYTGKDLTIAYRVQIRR